ncbi:MAG: hypothetical protein IKU42_07425, partial [Oscillospiraceae bacterium]|nr:hypothetical protein [Oscillospiraceae bacterium]
IDNSRSIGKHHEHRKHQAKKSFKSIHKLSFLPFNFSWEQPLERIRRSFFYILPCFLRRGFGFFLRNEGTTTIHSFGTLKEKTRRVRVRLAICMIALLPS